MPISSFRLKGTLGRNYKTDFNDTLRTKEALRDLDYYQEPSYGMTGYPDEALFSAIEEFQSDHGLQRDGIMKPGGPTADEMRVQLASINRDSHSDEDPGPLPGMTTDDARLAASSSRRAPFGPLPPFGPALDLGKKMQRWWDGNQWPDPAPANENKRTTVIDPFPLRPEPVEPPKIDNKTEFPASPPELPKLNGIPINEVMKNDPVVFQALRDEVIKEFQAAVHSHRGSPLTIGNNTELVTDIIPGVLEEWGPETASTFKHTHGAMDKDGNYKKERYLKNIETGGRKGSSNADASAEILGQMHDFNTGKNNAWERGSFTNLVKNNGAGLAEFFPKEDGMTHAEWRERCINIAREYFTRIYGPPKK